MRTIGGSGPLAVVFGMTLVACASVALAQPKFESAAPTAGGTTSQQANQMADKTLYQNIEYTNRNKKGPALVGHSRRDQEQQRDVPAEIHRRTTSRTTANSSSPTPISRCSSARTSVRS